MRHLLILAALALWSLPAQADIVLHDGGVERDREAGELVTVRTGNKPRMVLSGDVLAGPTRLLASNAEVAQCSGAPIEIGLASKLEGVVEAVLSFELDRAIEELDVLQTLLPCAGAPVSANELARVSFLRGAALLDKGDEAAATSAMADALAQDASFEGLKGFPKPHIDLLESLRGASASSGRLFVWHKAGAVESILVDGAEIGDSAREGSELSAGNHLVQVRLEDGSLTGMWVRTTGLDAVVVHPGAGRRVWADGGRSPGGEMAMRLMLLTEFQGQDGDIHVLRFKGRRVVSAATFPADGGVRSVWDKRSEQANALQDGPNEAAKSPAKAPSRRAPPAGKPSRLRFALGGGYQYVHPFSYGMVSADVGLRLVGPLTLTVFARPSFGGQFTVDLGESEPVQGGIVLVPFGVGLGVQKHDGPIGPFIFASFQAAPNQVRPLATLLIGATVQGGVDFAPGDGPLIVRVEGEAGFLGGANEDNGSFYAGFTGRIGVGVGARF